MTQPYTLSRLSLADLFPAHDSPEMQAAFADLEARDSAFEALPPSRRDMDGQKPGGMAEKAGY